jgi:hypothetical protein
MSSIFIVAIIILLRIVGVQYFLPTNHDLLSRPWRRTIARMLPTIARMILIFSMITTKAGKQESGKKDPNKKEKLYK